MIRIDAADLEKQMRAIGKALNKNADTKGIKREAAKRMRKIAQPTVMVMRQKVRSLPSGGKPKKKGGGHGASARAAIANQTRVNTRWGGRSPGVSIVQRARGMPRQFNMVGRMFNRSEGWNPTRLDGSVVHQQMSPSGWFDDETPALGRAAYMEMIHVLDDVAGKIARDTHG